MWAIEHIKVLTDHVAGFIVCRLVSNMLEISVSNNKYSHSVIGDSCDRLIF